MAETDQLRLAVGAAQNRNLFPVHFLEQRLPEWPEYAGLDCTDLLAQLKEIWDRERDLLPSFNEDQTEDRLVRPILGVLGFSYTSRPALDVAGRRREPDYALFLDSTARGEAEAVGGSARYLQAVAVLEAKRFDRPLDRRRASGSLSEDPVAQVIHYVGTTKVPFGILTNGRIWRLYAERGDLIEGAHYEVDLIALLESGDAKALRAFAALFSANAFRPDRDGRSFLDRVLDESRSNAIAVGDALQRQVFDGLPQIARGLLGDAPVTKENLTLAFENSLVFLYRLLFCLHAEARGLLPVDSPHYLEYSVRRQRRQLAAAIDGDRKFGHATARLYNELEALFALVDAGDEALGVNEYNGGHFSAAAHRWLAGRAVPDDLLAPALDGLYRLDGQAIDYRDLSVRHLGTIYERLLAYELAPDTDSGGLTLVEAPGRGDTGSYFTPEPIVDLIVERTLEPLLECRSAAVAEKGLTGGDALDAFLTLRVVDPAMGSGHFLVSAAAYIAQFIATDPSYQGDLEWREIQRLVAERCLYGVDLNPMAVELARLALWLSTVSDAEPLTFLGNLRVGNSLVGADVDDLSASAATLFAERLARDAEQLLARVGEITAQASDSGEAVHEKEATSLAAAALREPLTQVADEVVARISPSRSRCSTGSWSSPRCSSPPTARCAPTVGSMPSSATRPTFASRSSAASWPTGAESASRSRSAASTPTSSLSTGQWGCSGLRGGWDSSSPTSSSSSSRGRSFVRRSWPERWWRRSSISATPSCSRGRPTTPACWFSTPLVGIDSATARSAARRPVFRWRERSRTRRWSSSRWGAWGVAHGSWPRDPRGS